MMNVVPGRNGFDLAKSWLLEPSSEYHMPVHPFRTRRQLRKRHLHLKSDAGLLGKNSHRSAALDRFEERFVDFTDFVAFAFKVVLQIVISTEVRLIPVREFAFALRALPERPLGESFHSHFCSSVYLFKVLEATKASPAKEK